MWENNCRKASCGVKFFKWLMIPLFVLAVVIYVTVGVNAGVRINNQEIAGPPVFLSKTSRGVTSTNRPMRNRRNLVLTVGQTEGDLQGRDDKTIQAGIEYLDRVGGGTLHILPGVYNLQNAIYLRPNITLRGSGERTVLRKTGSVVTPLLRDSDWYEYGVQVNDVEGFTPGGGVMLRSKKGTGDWQYDVLRATVTAIQGDVLFLDRLTKENFWVDKDATAATIFPILTAVRNTRLENTAGQNQKIGIRISEEAERTILQGNTFENCPVRIENLRSKMALGVVPLRAAEQSTGRLAAKSTNPQSTVHIIPHPVALEVHDGLFRFTTGTQVVALPQGTLRSAEAKAEAVKLLDYLTPAMGYRLSLLEDSSRVENVVRLEIESSLKEQLGEEGYQLEVTTRSIVIRAAKPAGLFYGIQTLRQLLPPAIFNKQKVEGIEWAVPCVRITDYPRFKWRGLLIDPARHFIPKQNVKRFIDTMALHKFNRLQMHLTDDQGWRIEIKKYPQLTEIGAWMDFTTMRSGRLRSIASATQRGTREGTGGQHTGGFYTQDDIHELVRYSAERYITIVPEIEMPAHTGAAIVSCPDIGLYPDKLKNLPPEKRWTANERILAPRPQTVAFMQDVLTEVMKLFPGRYIHIGGDEANKDHWKRSEEMQALILRLGLKDEAGLHSWFIRQMDAFLTRHGRLLVGWDEILQGGLAPGAVVMSWRGQAGGITAAKAGHNVIMAPTSHTYFDYYQGPAKTEPKAIGGHIPLEKVYQFEPAPSALDTGQAKRVLGGQGQLWGEYITDRKHREYMAYPRAAALSEVLWSSREGRSYELFLNRLVEHLKRLNEMDVNFRPLDR
ncbi:MAG: beta-N-acetylhexosaminidase [Planctomycetota bacterium]